MTSSLSADTISRIFPYELADPASLEARFPARDLPEGAMVTRVGPSPTGMMHIGTLYVGRLCTHFARQTGGVSILRIEDTDKKREVEGAVEFIDKYFAQFDTMFDESIGTGDYGPYRQSERKPIYQSFVKYLLEKGLAYPCFATPEELSEIRDKQKARKLPPGYYGTWAIWREKTEEEVTAQLDAGAQFVIRFRSRGSHARKVTLDDLIFGERQFVENTQDVVIMKSDGLPTYHFAHVVDDHLMRITHIIRGDEWLSSVPTHLELFEALGWEPPRFAHIAPINKMDGQSRRKLSKRKDPEASVAYFTQAGYPESAVLEYLMTLTDAGFEEWKKQNPKAELWDFPLGFAGLRSSSGPLFDFAKLGNISRNYIADLTADQVYDAVLDWAQAHDAELETILRNHPDTARAIFSIERGGANARKDLEQWSQVKEEILLFFDDSFALQAEDAQAMLPYLSKEELAKLAGEFLDGYDAAQEKDAWFDGLKALGAAHGFALRPKDFKKNPDDYKGTVADVAKVFRVLLMGRERTPDLYSIMQVLGEDAVRKRISLVL